MLRFLLEAVGAVATCVAPAAQAAANEAQADVNVIQTRKKRGPKPSRKKLREQQGANEVVSAVRITGRGPTGRHASWTSYLTAAYLHFLYSFWG